MRIDYFTRLLNGKDYQTTDVNILNQERAKKEKEYDDLLKKISEARDRGNEQEAERLL